MIPHFILPSVLVSFQFQSTRPEARGKRLRHNNFVVFEQTIFCVCVCVYVCACVSFVLLHFVEKEWCCSSFFYSPLSLCLVVGLCFAFLIKAARSFFVLPSSTTLFFFCGCHSIVYILSLALRVCSHIIRAFSLFLFSVLQVRVDSCNRKKTPQVYIAPLLVAIYHCLFYPPLYKWFCARLTQPLFVGYRLGNFSKSDLPKTPKTENK